MAHSKTQSVLVTNRAKLQYIGSCTRPDLYSSVQLLVSEVINNSATCYNKLNKIIKWCRETCNIGLNSIPLDLTTLRLMLFTDPSLANVSNLQSQIRFVIVLADDSDNANIIHYGSSQCKRVTRSVMATELIALVHVFDIAYLVRQMLQEMLTKKAPIDGYVDSRTVSNVAAKESETLEKTITN